eukprot:993712-Amorphochlora_amoeboformis.AAC.1
MVGYFRGNTFISIDPFTIPPKKPIDISQLPHIHLCCPLVVKPAAASDHPTFLKKRLPEKPQ